MNNRPNANGCTTPGVEPTAGKVHDPPMPPGLRRFSCCIPNHRNVGTSAHAECGLYPSLQILRVVKRSFPETFSWARQQVFQMAFRHKPHWESIPLRGKELAARQKVRSAT